ncbi:hypothetical protein R6Z07F_006095 [Ovis aries]
MGLQSCKGICLLHILASITGEHIVSAVELYGHLFFVKARSRESASRRPASDSEPRAASSAAGQPRTREGLHAPASQPTPGTLQPGEATGANPAAGLNVF